MSTVVIDPQGSPEPLFLRSGIAVEDVVAANATPPAYASPTPIPLSTDYVIARVAVSVSDTNAVELPSGASIGVVVEVHPGPSGTLRIFAPAGENINGAAHYSFADDGRIFRKITETNWGRIGG